MTADRVLASLNRTLEWYRQARVAMRSAYTATAAVFTRDDQKTALTVVQRAFDAARAEAALVGPGTTPAPSGAPPADQAAEERARIQRAIQSDEQEIEQLRKQLRTARAVARPALQQSLVAATNRLELDRAHLDLVEKFQALEASAPGTGADLAHQIAALEESVPELHASGALDSATPVAAPATGTAALMHRLLALERSRNTLDDLADATTQLARAVDAERHAFQASLQPIATRLRALASDPTADGTPLSEGERTFHELLARANLMGAVLLPLREESAVVHRYATDLAAWRTAIDRDLRQTLQSLALGLVGVVIALVVILIGAVLWRAAVVRYVQDAYRRRLAMMVRNVVAVAAIALVLVFHFASELAALVTGLGFAAAGIAFALQNVILAIAGYFSMMAPNGIRVGDCVSLQGPFGYVQGEVLEIGLVRIRLRELAGEPLRPTGRVVVFPNSVVFTGSFFKHPSADEPAESARGVEPGAAA